MNINKDVEVLRESIRVITQLLTNSDIRVTQTGVDAYVKADTRTGKPILINLPYLPDDASEELILAIQGYLDHEVAHALFSDFEKAPIAAKKGGVLSTHNIVEDAFVERKMSEKFRGSSYNISKVRQFYLDKFVAKVLAEGDDAKIQGVLTVTAIRAYSGQQIFIDFMKDKWHLIDRFNKAVEPLADEIASCENSMDCVNVAIKIKDALKKPKEEAPPPPPSPEEEEEGGDSEEEGDDSEEEGDDSEEEGDDSEEEEEEEEEEGDSEEGDDIEEIINNSGAEGGLKEALSVEIVHTAKTSDYSIFTDEDDVLEPLPKEYWGDERQAKNFEDEVSHMTAPIQKDIERAICAKTQSVWQNGKRSGRLNGSNLSRLAVGDDRIFRRREVSDSKDVTVSLVIDCSGSMMGDEMRLAAQAGFTLSSVLSRLNINHEVIGFTTKGVSRDNRARRLDQQRQHGIRYARNCGIYMPIFKQYGESMTMDVKRRMCNLSYAGFMNCNVDGESIVIAAKRLMAQREKGKIMIVLSDGMPAGDGPADFDQHLKDSVAMVENWGVNTVGIGINSHCVEKFYPKSIYVNHVDQLPTVVAKQLKVMLLRS